MTKVAAIKRSSPSMKTYAPQTILIPRLGGQWIVTIHGSEQIPADAINYGNQAQRRPGVFVGFLKRLGRTNGGRDSWHIVPWTDLVDGSRWYSLYVGPEIPAQEDNVTRVLNYTNSDHRRN